jgi:hypothetical protein
MGGGPVRWFDGLDHKEKQFLEKWAADGNGTRAYLAVHPDAWQKQATIGASKLLKRLHGAHLKWGERSDPLPTLDRAWLLGLLDEIARKPGLSDRNLQNAMALRQELDPVDVRTYPDFVVKLNTKQAAVFADPTRHRVVVAGRRFGKTHEAVTELIVDASTPGSNGYYLGKTRRNAKKAPWKIFKKLVNLEYISKISEPEGFVRFTNGSEIQFDGVEIPDNLRGDGLTMVILEEYASWKDGKKVWDQVIRPMLSDREGRALFIGTPAGYNHFRDIYVKGLDPDEPEWSSAQYTTLDGGIVTQGEIDAAKADTNPRSFRQEYEASFEQLANQVYDYFDRGIHAGTTASAGARLLVGIDFNLDPMTCVIAQKDENGDCEVLEALELNFSNTDELLEEVENRYPEINFLAYPDPSGRSRHTSAGGKTDFSLIDDRPRWRVDAVMYRKSIPLADKINNTQANLRDANNKSHVTIDAVNAVPLVEGLEGLAYIEGTSQPDKTAGKDHITDAFAYLLWGAFNRFKSKGSIGTFAM